MQHDFLRLAEAAHPDGGQGPREAMESLWRAVYELDEWLFAVSPGDPTSPYRHVIDGRTWAFAFTDSTQLERFALENGIHEEGQRLLFLSMPSQGARAWLNEQGTRGLYGVHFNFAGPGWFAPVPNLDAIHRHLFGA